MSTSDFNKAPRSASTGSPGPYSGGPGQQQAGTSSAWLEREPAPEPVAPPGDPYVPAAVGESQDTAEGPHSLIIVEDIRDLPQAPPAPPPGGPPAAGHQVPYRWGFSQPVPGPPPPPPVLPEAAMPLGAVPSETRVFSPSTGPPDNLHRTPVEPGAEMDPQALMDFYGEPEEPEPWEGVLDAEGPRDHPYFTCVGINRFRGWNMIEPPEVSSRPLADTSEPS